MSKSKIEWTDAVWNPTTGCTKVSPGCAHCYAERMSKRLAGRCGYPKDDPFRVTLHPEKFEEPLKWKKPRRIFVNSMSDLFHEDVPFEFVDRVMNAAYTAKQHVYLVLTKRPERMKLYFESCRERGFPVVLWMQHGLNLWLGVSVENQATADKRIPLLLQTPAAVRFISAEPLLGSVDLAKIKFDSDILDSLGGCYYSTDGSGSYLSWESLDWVIVGGESGPGARPMHPDWVRSLRDQCQESGTKFFFKQWGEWKTFYDRDRDDPDWRNIPEEKTGICRLNMAGGLGFHGDRVVYLKKVGKQKAGRELDGRTWDEMP